MFEFLPSVASYTITLETPGTDPQTVVLQQDDVMDGMVSYTFENLMPGEMYIITMGITHQDGNEVVVAVEEIVMLGKIFRSFPLPIMKFSKA